MASSIDDLKIEFCVLQDSHADFLHTIFAKHPAITITKASITSATYPVLITAGNSFGEMGGGVDGIIRQHLSPGIDTAVKAHIAREYYGELPIGSSLIIPTTHSLHTRLIYAPTMRISDNVSHTINAYLAFRSALITALQNGATAVSTPLFCTGVGNMHYKTAIKQMYIAYTSILNAAAFITGDWSTYIAHHELLINA
jgi:O-acetyl-ADP-ribose deacetylase (regulator of RNase III)